MSDLERVTAFIAVPLIVILAWWGAAASLRYLDRDDWYKCMKTYTVMACGAKP